MSDIERIVALVEAAEGPSFALETAIYKVLRPDEYQARVDRLIASPIGPRLHPVDYDGYIEPPPYTVSLDAALTLVPEGWRWCIGNAGYAGVEPPTEDPDEPEPTTSKLRGKTPALALVAAALRAHIERQAHD